jgi:hypothetical protein
VTNVKAGVFLEEDILYKKICGHVTHSCNTVLQMQWILFNVYIAIKTIVLSIRIYPNA